MTKDEILGQILDNWTPPPPPIRDVMEGQYVRLEPLSASAHAAALFDAYAADTAGRVWRYMSDGPYASLASYNRWVKSAEDADDTIFYAVKARDTGQVAGILSFLRIQAASGSIEVGNINFSPALQRTRAASEAIILTARHAFALGYRRFEWKCNALNIPSRRAAERYGFSYEGTFRQATVVKGRNRDTAWFAMIDQEFAAIDAAYAAWLKPENFTSDGQQIHRLSDLTAPLLVSRDPALTS